MRTFYREVRTLAASVGDFQCMFTFVPPLLATDWRDIDDAQIEQASDTQI